MLNLVHVNLVFMTIDFDLLELFSFGGTHIQFVEVISLNEISSNGGYVFICIFRRDFNGLLHVLLLPHLLVHLNRELLLLLEIVSLNVIVDLFWGIRIFNWFWFEFLDILYILIFVNLIWEVGSVQIWRDRESIVALLVFLCG